MIPCERRVPRLRPCGLFAVVLFSISLSGAGPWRTARVCVRDGSFECVRVHVGGSRVVTSGSGCIYAGTSGVRREDETARIAARRGGAERDGDAKNAPNATAREMADAIREVL